MQAWQRIHVSTKETRWLAFVFFLHATKCNFVSHKRKVMTLSLTQHYYHLFSLPIFLPILHDPLSSTTITGSSSTYCSNLLVIRLKLWSLILSAESFLFTLPLLSVPLESEIAGVPRISTNIWHILSFRGHIYYIFIICSLHKLHKGIRTGSQSICSPAYSYVVGCWDSVWKLSRKFNFASHSWYINSALPKPQTYTFLFKHFPLWVILH